jgi:subtilisin-like proprotein convertase family protein
MSARAARLGQGLDSKGERMTKKRSARMALLASVSVASLGLLVGPASATAKAKKKTVTKTATVSQCVNASGLLREDPLPIATAVIPVTVPNFKGGPQDGVVTGFTSAGVRITHTSDLDLAVSLVSPGGKVIQLATGRGGSGDGFGTGAANCSGSLALFGDAFTTPVPDLGNDDPVTGGFKPDQPLNQVVGGPARGSWILLAVDEVGGDEGTLDAFSLNFTYSYKALKKVKKKKKKK